MLDIFNGDAFSVRRLTDAINDIEHVPGRIGELGLFEEESVDTTIVSVEKKGDSLIIVPATPRGGPGASTAKTKRQLVDLRVPHFQIDDAIYAEEVQNVRAFGFDGALEMVVTKVDGRLAEHSRSMDVTQEYSRMGALQGVVVYEGDDEPNLDLFAKFGVSQVAEIDFDLDNLAAAEGALRKKCANVVRAMSNELKGIPFTGIHAFCGDNFFDDLLSNPEVRETFKGWSEAKILREGYVGPNRSSYGIFEFGGIVWENYRGLVGTTTFVNSDKCHMFPIGGPGLFKTVYAPADYEETVNTMGEPRYSRQYPMSNGKGRELEVQMNNLEYCKRPRCLLKGKRT